MAVAEISRTGVDVLSNVWDFRIYGDPSVSGFVAGVGSRAVQFDSSPVGAVWAKTGTNATDWTQVQYGPGNPITVAALPDLSGTIDAQMLDLLTNPFAAPPGLTPLVDLQFALAGR